MLTLLMPGYVWVLAQWKILHGQGAHFPSKEVIKHAGKQVNVSSQDDFLWLVLFPCVRESPRNYKINETLEFYSIQ